MKTKKLLRRLAELTSHRGSEEQEEREAMKALLKSLKKRQKELEHQLASKTGDKKRRLRDKIRVIKAQRKKGIALYRELRGR